jgi:hypothetical protein
VIAQRDVLPVAAEVGDGERFVIEHADEARRSAAVLHVRPAGFRHRRHVETVARRDELPFAVGEAIERPVALERRPVIAAAVGVLRFLHARRACDIEKAVIACKALGHGGSRWRFSSMASGPATGTGW